MANEPVAITKEEPRLFTNPWPALLTGVAATVIGCLLLHPEGTFWTLPGILVLLVGLLATGAAVAIAPRKPAILLSAAGVALVAAVTTRPRWDTIGLLLAVLAGIAVLAAVLVWMSRPVRRGVVSAMIVFHFAAILNCVADVSPWSSWVADHLQVYVYKPYIEFMFLVNAYHFYSPEPGPAMHLWFRVAYTDAAKKEHGYWVRIPNRGATPWYDPLYHSYQRQLSLTEGASQLMDTTVPDYALERQRMKTTDRIPIHPEFPLAAQYQEPQGSSKKMLQTYARHVCGLVAEQHPDWHIEGVKIYRVRHQILWPNNYLENSPDNIHPDSELTFFPYYQGEFDPEGNLQDPDNPLLYWLIPIMQVPRDNSEVQPQEQFPGFRALVPPKREPTSYKVVNYLKKHAGDEAAEKDMLPPFDGEWK
jgi:hypothetical protein